MRNLKYALGIALLISSGFLGISMAQEIDFTASRFDVINSSISKHRIFGHDRDHFFVIQFTGTQYFVKKLDSHLNLMIEEPVKLFKGLTTYQFEGIFHFHNEIYVFATQTRLTDITLYYQKLNKNDLQPTSEWIEITTVKCVKGAWADFHFALSRHETKLLVASRIKLGWSHTQFNELYVYGEDLSVLWKRKDSYVFRGAGPRDNLYLLDEVGNVSILSLLRNESYLSLIREVKNAYSIYRYTQDGNDFKEYPFTLTDRYIRDIKIAGTDQGDLVCAGLYSEQYNSGIKGTFFILIDAYTGGVVEQSLSPYDEATHETLSAMKEPMLKGGELMNYVITDLILRGNGKVLLIAEQLLHQSSKTFNNLIITSYDMRGAVYWTRVVGKKQNFNFTSLRPFTLELLDYRYFIRETGFVNTNLDNYCSYALMAPLDKAGIILFYNDNIKNLDPASKRAFKQPKKSYLRAISIDEFGNLSEKSLVTWKKGALYPEPMRFYDTRSDTIVIPAFRYRNVNYYKITAAF